ncbi:hypothetical protein N7454_005306 [Penicillium verhagenii]|nr:hypothetical protein N7454_005306 [Penicillium verhagenii]
MTDKAAPSLEEAHQRLYEEGLKIRLCKILLQRLVGGSVWARPGLDRKQRSLLNIGMLCALNRGAELAVHVRGGVTNGLSETEIREALLQVSIYVGMPAGLEGFRIAEKVLQEIKEQEAQSAN